jgi:hypothetical protein
LRKAFQPSPDEISGDAQSLGHCDCCAQGGQADAAFLHKQLYRFSIGLQHADLLGTVRKENLMVMVEDQI